MTKDDREIVSAVQHALAGKVGTQLVAMWASSSFTWHFAEERLTLYAPDAFRLDRLRKFRPQLHAAACEVVLLDTNAVIWLDRGHARTRALTRSRQSLHISPATLLELQFLEEAGRIRLFSGDTGASTVVRSTSS